MTDVGLQINVHTVRKLAAGKRKAGKKIAKWSTNVNLVFLVALFQIVSNTVVADIRQHRHVIDTRLADVRLRKKIEKPARDR